MKNRDQGRENCEEHWVGLDVSKRTFDAALAGPNQRFPSTPLRALPWKALPRTREGVVAFLAWLNDQVLKRKVRVIMEATGQYLSWRSRAKWLQRPKHQRHQMSPLRHQPSWQSWSGNASSQSNIHSLIEPSPSPVMICCAVGSISQQLTSE